MYVIQPLDRLDLNDHFFINNKVPIVSPHFLFAIDDLELFFFNDLPTVQRQIPAHCLPINFLKKSAPDGIMDSESRGQNILCQFLVKIFLPLMSFTVLDLICVHLWFQK
jgi:hypothetical protein